MGNVGTKVTRSVQIAGGQTWIKPSNATITSVIRTGDGVASSECELPAPTPLKCYKIKWELQDGDVWTGVLFGGNMYNSNTGGNTIWGLIDFIQNTPALSTLITCFCGAQPNDNVAEVFLSIPESMVETFEVKVNKQIQTGDFPYYIHPIQHTGCSDCNNYI